MIPDIFNIEKGKIVININCLLVPELKAVHDKYNDPIPAFSFLHYMYTVKAPYCNIIEEDKEEVLLHDFPGEYTLEDDVMINAMKKIEELYISPSYRYYLDNKILLEKLGKFARTESISTGKDGTFSTFIMQAKSAGSTILEFKKLEETILKELSEEIIKVRGNSKTAYDQ